MQGHGAAEIICPIRWEVVRRLTLLSDGRVGVDALTDSVIVPLSTPITYEPWVFDRGSLMFAVPPEVVPGGQAKLCTEADIVQYPDGSEYLVMPKLEG